jgi:hypothetical protein
MLLIDNVQVIEGVTIYGDDSDFTKFYLVPEIPRFRINERGLPAFSFFKYRMPIERTDQSKGGGFLVCDVEFSVPDDKLKIIKDTLQAQINQRFANTGQQPPEVKIGSITYTRGTAKLNVENISSKFIETVFNPGKPSLYGRNITPFTLELTDIGATFFEQALQNKGGFVQVAYDLYCVVKLPPIRVFVDFSSSKFMSFVQDMEKTQVSEGAFRAVCRWLFGGTKKSKTTVEHNIEEVATEYNWGGVRIEFNDFKASDEVKQKIRDWAWASLAEAVKNAASEENKLEPITEEQKKIPDNVTEFHQRISKYKFVDYSMRYRESQAVEWNMAPQGTLEPIVNLKDKEGNPLKWEDFATTVDLDDPFFKTLEVPIRVNADFKDLPIDSVEVHCDYHEGTVHQINEYSINSPDKLEKFKSFIENGNWNYKYWYQVNYKGKSEVYKSKEIPTDEKFLTINVGDTGILAVDIAPGDLNWNQVTQAQVEVKYTSTKNGVPIERQYLLDKNNATHKLREVIFTPVSEPYFYRVKYFMEDGKEFQVSEKQQRSPILYINDPFSAMKRISLRAAGDLETEIQTIFLDVIYADETNKYTKSTTVALSKSQPFFDWEFPAIDDRVGKVTYKGTIQLKNGQVEEIPQTETEDITIMVGRKIEDVLTVKVLPNLVDFTKVDLVIVSLDYSDLANDINEHAELVFDGSSKTPQSWVLPLKDKDKNKYEWSATFYMKDGTERKASSNGLTPVLTIPLKVPAA